MFKLVEEGAAIVGFGIFTQIRVVVPTISPPLVFDAVVVLAVLVVVLKMHLAGLNLKLFEDQVFHALCFQWI